MRASAVAWISALVATAAAISGTFETEQGGLKLGWNLDADSITFTLQANASSYVAIGFGTGMRKSDVILCWVDTNGNAHAVDSWAVNHSLPLPDESFGGTNDVKAISGSIEGNTMSIVFQRPLHTNDSFDATLPVDKPFNVIFAWSDGAPGNLVYHRKQHGHWMMDLSKQDGVPSTTFGAEMQGAGSRYLVSNMTVGSLTTLNNADGSGAAGMGGFPYSSVTSFADFGDGRPIVLLSQLERNIVNQNIDGRCSLEIHDVDAIYDGMEPMMVARTTLMGYLKEIARESDDYEVARESYLAAHPDSEMWIDFGDFALYFLDLKDVYWVGGFGGSHYIGWVSPADYLKVIPSLWSKYEWQASLPENTLLV